jgi:hypothetical protein
MFKPFIKFNKIDLDIGSKLKVDMGPLPSYIHILKTTPEKVEYLIEKKSVKSRNNRGYR